MFMRDKSSGDMVEILDISALVNPGTQEVIGRFHAGEEMPDEQAFAKEALTFPSGELLPRCWVDPNYRS